MVGIRSSDPITYARVHPTCCFYNTVFYYYHYFFFPRQSLCSLFSHSLGDTLARRIFRIHPAERNVDRKLWDSRRVCSNDLVACVLKKRKIRERFAFNPLSLRSSPVSSVKPVRRWHHWVQLVRTGLHTSILVSIQIIAREKRRVKNYGCRT